MLDDSNLSGNDSQGRCSIAADSGEAEGAPFFSLLFTNSCIKKIYFCPIKSLPLHGTKPRAKQQVLCAVILLFAILQEA